MILQSTNVLPELCKNMVLSLALVAMRSRAWDKGVHADSLLGGVIPEDGHVDWEKGNMEGGTQRGHLGFSLTGTFQGAV